MSKVTKFIKAETRTSKKTGKDYVVNVVLVDDKEVAEAFGTVKEGDEGALTYNEQFKKWEFKKGGSVEGKTYQADPKKLEQELKLEVAKQQSIQRQVSLKGVVDLVVAGKREYADLQVTFDDLMGLLEKKKLIYPPISEDYVPTEEDINGY